MPTADEFDIAAHTCREVRDELSVLVAPSSRLVEAAMVGGRLTASVDDLLDRDEFDARQAAVEVDEIAAECAWRAAVCRAYEADLADHRRDLVAWDSRHGAWRRRRAAYLDGLVDTPPGAEPQRPRRPSLPAAWVEI